MVSGYVHRWDGVPYPAQAERRIASAHLMPGPGTEVFSGRSGRRVNGKGLAVTVDSTGAGSYSVTAGSGVIYDSASAAQGAYEFEIDAGVSNVSFPARPGAGTSRIDLIVVQITDSGATIGVTKDAVITRVPGTPGSSPSAPALPALSMLLSTVTIPSSGAITAVATATVTVAAGGILPVATIDEMTALVTAGIAYRGLVVDNAQTGALHRYNGTAWKQLAESNDMAPVTVGSGGGAPAYQNSWAAAGEGTTFSKRNGWVELTIVAAKGSFASAEVIFTLPSWAWPDRTIRFMGQNANALRHALVNTDGTVVAGLASTGGIATSVVYAAAT